jgi:hypothetical protein
MMMKRRACATWSRTMRSYIVMMLSFVGKIHELDLSMLSHEYVIPPEKDTAIPANTAARYKNGERKR